MRLIAVEIEGYRRFAQRTKLVLDAKLVAIVGPNEAGKTSVLDALRRLDDDEVFGLEDRSRVREVADDDLVIEALYLVEPDDLKATSSFPGGDEIRWFTVRKYADGERTFDVTPRPVRDKRARRRALELLQGFRASVLADAAEQPANSPYHARRLDTLEEMLAGTREIFPAANLNLIEEFGAALKGTAGQDEAIEAFEQIQVDEATHPADEIAAILETRRPRFLAFGTAERELATDYDLGSVAATPPTALANLAGLAQLPLRNLQTALANDQTGEARFLLDRANERLAEAFESWSQEQLTVYLDHVGNQVLRLHVRDQSGRYSKLGERSDGLRIFVALVALTAGKRESPPIILIDEAERHLHYDGQADLIQVFARQDALPQIIYTTHSAGCLPEDLGAGVRVVERVAAEGTSRIRTRFWTNDGGFMPLLLGLGASTLAFVPVRDAVMAEGGSEVVLLPSLLREATGRESLGFQVAPASAEAPAARIAGLDVEAPRVAWLVDGDTGGRAHRKKLEGAGVDPQRIVTIGGTGSGLVLEDLLDRDLYRAAVNADLKRGGHAIEVPRRTIVTKNRPGKLAAWLGERDLREPNKVDIANRVLELVGDEHPRLVDSTRRDLVVGLHAELMRVLEHQ